MEIYVNLLASTIINTYFLPSKCLYVFTDNATLYTHSLHDVPIIILDVERIFDDPKAYTKFYCDHFIVNTKTPSQTFENIEYAIRLGDNRFHFRTYLILPTNDLSQNTTAVFQSKSMDYVANIVAVFPENTRTDSSNGVIFNLYTHVYASLRNYNEVYLLDKWFSENSTFFRGSNLYPDKLTNQGGRTYRIGTITYKPYSVIDYLDGTELSATMEIVRRYNMTFTVTDFDLLWGEAYENFTGDGVLGNVAKDVTDTGFGSLFMYFSTYHYLDVAHPLVITRINVLVPAPKLEGGWFTPVLAFSISMWTGTIGALIFCFFAILFVTSLHTSFPRNHIAESVILSTLQTQSIFLGISVPKIPQDFCSRIVYALTMILSLVTATIFSCGLASNMTVPRYSGAIRTAKDFVDSGIKWGATGLAWVDSISDSDNPIYQKIVERFVVADVENLTKLNSNDFGYAVERLQEGNYALADYITEDGAKRRRLMDKDLFSDYIVIYTRKGSILLPLVNKMVLNIVQAGLVRYWEYLTISKYSASNIQTIVRFSLQPPKPVITPLEFSHVEGAFALWAFGLTISTICFIYELKKNNQLIIE